MTQNEEVLMYLKTHKGITQMSALRELGIMRLASRISDLRKDGVPIKKEMIGVKARNGRIAHVAKYSLAEHKECPLCGGVVTKLLFYCPKCGYDLEEIERIGF